MASQKIKYKVLLIIVLFFRLQVLAQEKSIENIDVNLLITTLQQAKEQQFVSTASALFPSDGKCGFPAQARLLSIRQQLSPEQQHILKQILQPSESQCVVTRGKFRIHYDTIGVYTPALLDASFNRIEGTYNEYVDSVGEVFNYVWDVEVNQMGYSSPIAEGEYYDIYIVEYNKNCYGETFFGEQITTSDPIRYSTYMQIDNDFKEFKTKGMDGLKVTAAHEFHHAIQITSYGYWDEDEIYAYELTSTWMESVVYPEIKDYYQYLEKYFYYFNGLPLNTTKYGYNGYERVVWPIFLAKRFGNEIMLKIWDEMRLHRFVESNEFTLNVFGSDLSVEFSTFSVWSYYTNYRADTVKYFPEGNKYPLFHPSSTVQFMGSQSESSAMAAPLSSTLFRFVCSQDTIDAMISNVDISSAIGGDTTGRSLKLMLSSSELPAPRIKLDNGIYASFDVDNLNKWRYSFFYNDAEKRPEKESVSPQPLVLNQSVPLTLPVSSMTTHNIEIGFYRLNGTLVYSSLFPIVTKNGRKVVIIPVNQLKNVLTSGIYLVIGNAADNNLLWKIAVVK